MTPATLHTAALIAYIGAAVIYGANLALRSKAHTRVARVHFLVGFVLHTAAIGAFCSQVHQTPFTSGFGTLSFAAWTVALLYLPIELFAKVPALGALALPVACMLMFGAFVRQHVARRMSQEISSGPISIHVLLVLFSFALFVLAACCAVFYLWQYGLLKRPNRRAFFRRLPPLETVDATAYHLVAFALPLLTLGLALGIIRAAGGGLKGNWMLDPHTIGSLVAWVVYGAYLLMRTVGGWRGAKPNYLLIAGLALTLALFIIPTTTHRFS